MTAPASTSTIPATMSPAAFPPMGPVMDCLDAAVLVVDCAGRIRDRNASARAWLSADVDLNVVFAGARFFEPFHAWEAVIADIGRTGLPVSFEGVVPLAPLTEPEIVTVRCTPWGGQGVRATIGVVILLVRGGVPRETDGRLDVSTRLVSLGKMAARVAHELNNPLDGILRYINLALRVAEEAHESKLKDYLSESRTGLMRMIPIIGDLLEYARGSAAVDEEVGINRLIEQAIDAVRPAADDKSIAMTFEPTTPDHPPVAGARLHQVLCNLLRNAVDATPVGGRITVRAQSDQQTLSIQVRDTGGGLPEPADRIFEPFFTTKPPGRGTGLGLAICREFVEGLGGRIEATNGENGGAVLTVIVPRSANSRPGQPAATRPEFLVGDTTAG